MKEVIGSQQRVHGLRVDEDRAEREDRQDSAHGVVGREAHAHGPRQEGRRPVVRHVKMVHQRDASDERAPPDKLPVLPCRVSPSHQLLVGSLQQDRKAIGVEVEVHAEAAETRSDRDSAELVQRQPEWKRGCLEASHVLECPRAALQPVRPDQVEGDGVLQLVDPLVLLEVEAEVGHLPRPQGEAVQRVSVLVETRHPVFHALPGFQHGFPGVHRCVVQSVVKVAAPTVYGEVAHHAVEAGVQGHEDTPKHGLRDQELERVEVGGAVDVGVRRANVL
mmetsp:Transcript_74164/g.194510  ORF Transcript_74164/g.194510 Transcript_74164/m.194510 type:complete len:277 (-) Transcript_74164:488-1318(-)